MKLKRKFSLATFLIAISVFAIGYGYVYERRVSGTDQLNNLIQKVGGYNFNQGLHEHPKPDSSFRAWLFGETHVVRRTIRFGIGRIDAKTGRAFARNKFAEGPVEKLTFSQTQIDENCPWFAWDSVHHLEFVDTATIPDSWIDAMAQSKSLKRVSFGGAHTDISFDSISKLKNLKYLRISNLGIYGDRLAELKSSLPGVLIRTSGLWGEPWRFAPDETLSKHNPKVLREMQQILDELKAELAKLDLPATNKFNPPATLEEIASVEQKIGQALPSSVRALLEIHNGQPNPDDALFPRGPFMDTDSILIQFAILKHSSLNTSHDFERWPPFNMNFAEPILPSVASLGIDLDDGSLLRDAWSGTVDTNQTLQQYLRLLTKTLKDGKYKQNAKGKVQIDAEPGEMTRTLRKRVKESRSDGIH